MAKTKIIEIDSLSQYIRYINKLDETVYYRGESKLNQSRKSSALRPYKFTWKSSEPFPFMKMIDEFYKETAYKLNEDKTDFIAFAQHHGIPTNLLDISSSPLTALYFACEKDVDESGAVYVSVPSYIDITELIHLFPNENIIEKVFSNTPKELNLLIPIFEKFKRDFSKEFEELLDVLIESYLKCFPYPLPDEENKFYKKLKRRKFDVFECTHYLREAVEELKEFPYGECDELIYFYLALQFFYLKKAREYTEPIDCIGFLPNMIYQPIIKFERGRNQQGLFMYQGYMTYIEPVYNFRVLAAQHLRFQNIEFHIKNKRNILKELDRIGINKKMLFCDYDSIAQYITEKYSVR